MPQMQNWSIPDPSLGSIEGYSRLILSNKRIDLGLNSILQPLDDLMVMSQPGCCTSRRVTAQQIGVSVGTVASIWASGSQGIRAFNGKLSVHCLETSSVTYASLVQLSAPMNKRDSKCKPDRLQLSTFRHIFIITHGTANPFGHS